MTFLLPFFSAISEFHVKHKKGLRLFSLQFYIDYNIIYKEESLEGKAVTK